MTDKLEHVAAIEAPRSRDRAGPAGAVRAAGRSAAAGGAPALIEIRGLTKLYRMGDSVVRALDGVDLRIERGDFVAITGASGSGKSTMMHLLGCLDRPTAGQYLLNGRDVSDLSDRELAATRNTQIGFVFQTFNLINRTTAVDNVGVPLFYARRAGINERSRRALERVGLGKRSAHKPSELSGGERQRVAIARAIVNDPPLLLADEPTGNLDSRTGEQIMDIFHRLNEQGVTIVIVTHEPDIAQQTRRVVQMRDGQIVSDQRISPQRPSASAAESMAASGGADPAGALAPAAPGGAVTPVVGPAEAIAADPGSDLELGPPRRVRGATAALVLSLIGIPLYGLSIAYLYYVIWDLGLDPAKMQIDQRQPPPALVQAGLIMMLGLLVGWCVGVASSIWSWLILRRCRKEPARWRGVYRTRAAFTVGLITAVGPFLYLLVAIAVSAAKFTAKG